MGVACQVVAPSLIPKGGSDKVKTDKRDSRRLARLGRAGELTPVRVPSPGEEAVRDLARARDAVLADRRRAQQRLTAALMRHGRIWRGGSYWTAAHRAWIAAQRFGEPALAPAITTGPRWPSGRPSWPRSKRNCCPGRAASRWLARWPGWAVTGASPSWAG
jgi:transposase